MHKIVLFTLDSEGLIIVNIIKGTINAGEIFFSSFASISRMEISRGFSTTHLLKKVLLV